MKIFQTEIKFLRINPLVIFLFLILVSCSNHHLFVSEGYQDTSWFKLIGPDSENNSSLVKDTSGFDFCNAVTIDQAENVYCAGQTDGDLGETNGGQSDAFVMKLSSSGEILWIRQLGSETQANSTHVNDTSGSERCFGVALDSLGNVYCAGVTTGGLSETPGGDGNGDSFVMKLNTEGEIIWIRQLGSDTQNESSHILDADAYDSCNAIAVNNSGIYCAGHTSGSLGEVNGGYHDAFIMKLNSDGDIQWLKQIGQTTQANSNHINSTANRDICTSIALDSSDNIFCAGTTHGDLGETNGGNEDAFIIKLNSQGSVQWIRQLGLTTQTNSSHVVDTSQGDHCSGVSVDSLGNIYCAGKTYGGLGETQGSSFSDAFILKLNSNGDVQWLKQLGLVTQTNSTHIQDTSHSDECSSITVDSDQNIYCAGKTSGPLGSSIGESLSNAFVLKLNSQGSIQWLTQLTPAVISTPGYIDSLGLGITVNPYGSPYLAGAIGNNTNNLIDALIVKLKTDGSIDVK